MKVLNRIMLNKKYCLNFALKWTGIAFTVLSVFSLFEPFDKLMNENTGFVVRLISGIVVVAVVFLITYIISLFVVFHKNKITLLNLNNNHNVYVQYGDVFSEDILDKSFDSKKRKILIAVNRCFDTIVDDNLVSSNTLHGSAIKKFCSHMTTLNDDIQNQLANKKFSQLQQTDKPKGNLKRYDEGEVVEIACSSDVTFFFMGLSSFDKLLHANVTFAEYVSALGRALDFCISRSQGYPLVIPLIGAGGSQTGIEENDILEFLIKLIKMRKSLINCDVHIVVRESAKEAISITNFK